MSIEKMIKSIADGDSPEANSMFKQEIGARISDAIEAKKVEIGKSIYKQED